MDLLNFMDEETKNKLDSKESENLDRKHDMVDYRIISGEETHKVEQEIYKPKKLEKIKLDGNINFGERTKVSFFITSEEFELLKKKWKIIEQFDENRIASSQIEKFVEVVLNG